MKNRQTYSRGQKLPFFSNGAFRSTLEAMENDDAIEAHVDEDAEGGGEADGPSWLANRVNRVDDRVRDPADAHQSEQPLGEHLVGIRQDEEQAHDHERHDVLQVVQVCPPNSLNRVVLDAHVDSLRGVFGILKGLERKNETNCSSRTFLPPSQIFTFVFIRKIPVAGAMARSFMSRIDPHVA